MGAFQSRGTSNTILVRTAAKDELEASWEPATASGIKKATSRLAQLKKAADKAEEAKRKQETDDFEKRQAELKKREEAKLIVLEQPTTPAAKIKIKMAVQKRGERVRLFGWVHALRKQGGLTFIVLRDGTGYLQCVLAGRLVSTPALVSLKRKRS